MLLRLLLVLLCSGWLAAPARAQSTNVILSTTTSTQDSGLLDLLVPMFEKKTGLSVKTVSVGTGQALALAGRAFELAEIPPRRPVRHAHALDGLLEGAEPFHRVEQLGTPLAELDVPKDNPELEPRPAFDRAPHPAYLVRTRPTGTA